jgi:DNA-binding beta-propeller fold protein YncE
MTGNGSFVLADSDTFIEMDGNGESSLWVAGLPYDEDILGVRFARNGLLYASMGLNSSEIWTFSPDGGELLLDTGLELPNAIHIDHDDQLWVSDYFGDTVSRIDIASGTVETVVDTQANSANGVFFDEQRSILYWATYQSSRIWSATINGPQVGAPTLVADLEGFSDGITMDECGHLYVVDQGGVAGDTPCRIDRITLDANGAPYGEVVELAPAGSLGNGCANAQFGYGFDNEFDQAMFVTGQQGGVYRVQVGISGYPIALPD